jgi:hypothetical protein
MIRKDWDADENPFGGPREAGFDLEGGVEGLHVCEIRMIPVGFGGFRDILPVKGELHGQGPSRFSDRLR